jgi:hypothetical protein
MITQKDVKASEAKPVAETNPVLTTKATPVQNRSGEGTAVAVTGVKISTDNSSPAAAVAQPSMPQVTAGQAKAQEIVPVPASTPAAKGNQ